MTLFITSLAVWKKFKNILYLTQPKEQTIHSLPYKDRIIPQKKCSGLALWLSKYHSLHKKTRQFSSKWSKFLTQNLDFKVFFKDPFTWKLSFIADQTSWSFQNSTTSNQSRSNHTHTHLISQEDIDLPILCFFFNMSKSRSLYWVQRSDYTHTQQQQQQR